MEHAKGNTDLMKLNDDKTQRFRALKKQSKNEYPKKTEPKLEIIGSLNK